MWSPKGSSSVDMTFIDYIALQNGSPCHKCLINTMCERRIYNQTICSEFFTFYCNRVDPYFGKEKS